MTWELEIAAFLLLTAGATVKGLLGIGLPMVAIPGLALFIGLPQALAVVSLPVLAANLWQVWQFREAARGDQATLPFVLSGGVGTAVGTLILARAPEAWLELALAVMLTIYIALRISTPDLQLARQQARKIALPIGLAAGVLQGATGISGPIGITFFHAQRPDRPRFIFATGAMFACFSLAQIPMLGATGILGREALTAGIASLPAIALGLWLGNRLSRRVKQRMFDKLVLVVLSGTACALLWRAFGGFLGAA